MDKLDLITITVAIYNAENYLHECIESIINQSYDNIEIILVNDGSTDSSIEICRSYKYDQRIKIINKVNEGLSSARQIGLENANGDYICFVDADDTLETNYIEEMHSIIKREKADICVCGTKFFNRHYEEFHGFNKNDLNSKVITKSDIENSYFEYLYKYYMSDSWNKMYRLFFLKHSKVEFSLPKKFNGTDLSFNHRLMLHLPKIIAINEFLYNHRIHDDSRVRRKKKELHKAFMIIMTQIIHEVNKLNFSSKINIQLNRVYIKFLKQAVKDVYKYSENKKELLKEIQQVKNDGRKYLNRFPQININTKNYKKIIDLFFFWSLKAKGNMPILFFLKLREIKLYFKKLWLYN